MTKTIKCTHCNGKGSLPSAEALKARRVKRGASARCVASLMKVEPAYLSRLENGKIVWTLDMIGRFDVAMEQIELAD